MKASQIKTPSNLKSFVENGQDNSLYFSRKAMKMFGDTMKNFGLRKVVLFLGEKGHINGWELYRKSPVKHGYLASTYWAPDGDDKVKRVFRIKGHTYFAW